MLYATVADLRGYLNQVASEQSDPGSDALLQAILDRAQSIVDGALYPVVFAPYGAASARRVLAYGEPVLLLPPHAIGSVAMVAFSGTALTGWAETAEGNLAIVVDDAPPPLAVAGPLGIPSWAAGGYEVTAIWGYGPPPDSAAELVLELAVNIWRSRSQGMFAQTQGADGDGSIRYVGGLNTLQRRIVDDIKRRYTIRGTI